MLRLKQVIEYTGLSRSTIYDIMDTKSKRYDSTFPRSVQLTQATDGIETNFPAAFRTRETADLFLVLIMQLLKSNGRAALVLPDGFLFGEGIKTSIKEKLLTECNLHT